MTLGYGISGIGLNPLGTMGLGMSGQYASYDAYMPSMMGTSYMAAMTNPMFAAGAMSGAYGMGMGMGMYNPTYWASAQQQIEASQIKHAGNMQGLVLNNEVNGLQNTDTALISKILVNGDITQRVQNLYDKVQEGDLDGVCEEFDKLKANLIKTYKDEIQTKGNKLSINAGAVEIIERIYGQMATSMAGDGRVHSLRDDIRSKGDSAFENGFFRGLKRDHHKRYVEEAMNHCFGLPIDQQGSKELDRKIGDGCGRVTSVISKAGMGAVGGVAVTGLALGGAKLVTSLAVPVLSKIPMFKNLSNFSWLKCMKSSWKPALIIGSLAAIAGDIIWQISNSSEK